VRELTDDQYRDAVELCRRVVTAATSDDGGPTVAGSFLSALRALFTPPPDPAGGELRLTPGLHEGPRWRQGGRVPHHVYAQRGDEPDRSAYPEGDHPIAMFVSPETAHRAVEAVNAVRVGLCGEVDSLRSQVEMLTAENERLHNDLQAKIAGITGEREQWTVFCGGPDPENSAIRVEYDGQVEAEGLAQWVMGGGVAHRTLYAGPWEITWPSRPGGEDG
jgi:hypothetical protein